MDFGKHLKNLRISEGMTQKTLAGLVQTTEAQISRWENNEKSPSLEKIMLLISSLNISANELLQCSDSLTREESSLLHSFRRLNNHGKKVVSAICDLEASYSAQETRQGEIISLVNHKEPNRYIPIFFTPAAAGSSAPLEDVEHEMLLVDTSVPCEADYALKIQGDSMFPLINDGDVVFVKKTSDIPNGGVGIFSVDGAYYCKHYFRDSNGDVTLVSHNESLKDTNVFIPKEGGRSASCLGIVLLNKRADLPEYYLRRDLDYSEARTTESLALSRKSLADSR